MLGLVFVTGLAVLVRYDVDIARWRDAVDASEAGSDYWTRGALMRGCRAFGEMLVMPAILVAVARLDRRRRLILKRVLLAMFLAWLFQGVGKTTVERLRPVKYESEDWAGMWQGVWLAPRPAAHSAFPSGHTTVAFAFGLTLAWFYPPLRWLLLLLAAGCGLSRLAHGAHWASDCWAGAWLGFAASWLALRLHRPGWWPRRRKST